VLDTVMHRRTFLTTLTSSFFATSRALAHIFPLGRSTAPPPPPPGGPLFPNPDPFFSGENGWNQFLVAPTTTRVDYTVIQVASGTVNYSGAGWLSNGGGPPANGTVKMRFTIDGVPTSPVLTGPPFSWDWDTTTVPDGAHCVSCEFIDSSDTTWKAYQLRGRPGQVIVMNSGPRSGAQTIPVTDVSWNARLFSVKPDFVTYPGHPVNNNTFPYPATFIPPSSDASLRDPNNWYIECSTEQSAQEYQTCPHFMTTYAGGVAAKGAYTEGGPGLDIYGKVPVEIRKPLQDGGRNDNTVTSFSNFTELPDGSGWACVELWGRVYKQPHAGSVTTIAGYQPDRSQLPLDYGDTTLPDSAFYAQKILVGTIGTPSFAPTSWSGINDLTFDPRDATKLYVANPLKHIIIKIDLSHTPPLCTRFAGQDGVAGYADGPAASARFNNPNSLTMMANGTMLIADSFNNSIRTVSPDGTTVGTLIGPNAGNPVAPGINTVIAATPYSVSSISWSSARGGTATIVLSGPSQVPGINATVVITGAHNSGTGGDGAVNNQNFLVNGFTDSQHFTIALPASSGAIATIDVSSAMLWSANLDVYSPPIPVAMADEYMVAPFTIDLCSDEQIVIGEAWSQCVRLIDPVGHTVKRIGAFGNNPGPLASGYPPVYVGDNSNGNGLWLWLTVNDAGAWGPVDDIIVFKSDSNPGAASATWRLSRDGSYSNFWIEASAANAAPPGGRVTLLALPGFGHYPWAVAGASSQARMISNGIGSLGSPVSRALLPGDPPGNFFTGEGLAVDNYRAGKQIWDTGTLINSDFPWDSRPSFKQVMGPYGNNHIGLPTFDDLMTMYPSTTPGDAGDLALAAYIQAGMGGSTPRPELSITPDGKLSNDLRDLIYFIRRSSVTGGGIPNASTQVSPGPDNPDTTAPIITSVNAVRVTSTSIMVSWFTNKPTFGLAAAGGPNSQTPAASTGQTYPYNRYQLEPWAGSAAASYGTSHTVTITDCPDVTITSPTHFAVLAKDLAGNTTRSADGTIG
jgi:hypothetical protein